MTSVILDSNLLPIPEDLANELGLHSGSTVEVTRTLGGFEVKPAPPAPGMRRGADGVWRTRAERMEIVDRLGGAGRRLLPDAPSQVEALIRDRELDDLLDQEDGM